MVVGSEIGRIGGPPHIVEGRPITRNRYEAVADIGAGLSIGEQIKLGRDTFTIVGLTRNLVASGGDPVVFMTLRDAQKLQFDLTPAAARRELARNSGSTGTIDTANAVLVQLLPGITPDQFAAEAIRWKHLGALTQEQQETILSRSVIERARRQSGLFTSLLLIVSTVVIGLIIYTMTIDKKKSIATLKLIGAPDSRIVGLIVQQALAMGVISFAVGAALINAAQGYFPRRVVLEPSDAALLFGIVLLVCRLIASALGVRDGDGENRSGLGTGGLRLMTAVVQIRGISKHFGEGAARVDALRDISLDIHGGSVIGLRGPSGSGKSTLLNVIGCILEPDCGRMTLNGELVYDQKWLRRDLRHLRLEKFGFIFQSHNLLPFLNAWENIGGHPHSGRGESGIMAQSARSSC